MDFVYTAFEFYIKNIFEMQCVKKSNTSLFLSDFKHFYDTLPIN